MPIIMALLRSAHEIDISKFSLAQILCNECNNFVVYYIYSNANHKIVTYNLIEIIDIMPSTT